MSDEKKQEDVVDDTTYENEKGEELKDSKKKDALVTCRILFISVLDKIYLVCLALSLIFSTFNNFAGDMTSVTYGFWGRVLKEVFTIIVIIITYFIYNWFYKCFVKTMLCVTKKEIYRETYFPFVRTETTIPLNRITGITAHKVLWIFRAVIIHQYHRFPVVFFTWNNQEFKDKVEELLTEDNTKVKNQFESKNILNKGQFKYVLIAFGALVAVIALLGVVRFFTYMFSDERTMPGVYYDQKESIELRSDGTCELNIKNIDNVTSCDWTYNSDSKTVNIDYKYEYKYSYSSYYYSNYTYEKNDSMELKYNNKVLTYYNRDFKKN